jgi:hypothetical protein
VSFKRADEMEMSINFRAMRLAWVFENVALLAWAIASGIRNDGNVFTLIMIIAAQNVIFFGGKLYMTRQMSGDNDEK